MRVRYIEPLSRAVERSITICFRPFDLGKWFVLGFACWLARLTQGGGGGSIPTPPIGDRDAEGAAIQGPFEALEELGFDPEVALGGGILAAIIGCAVLFLLVLIPLLVWLSSRGQFIFLDGVVHNRAAIKVPWAEYKTEGNSLFLWRLGFILVAILVVAVAVLPVIIYAVRHGDDALPAVAAILVMIFPAILVVIGLTYVDLFLRSFVVPIMYKERLRTNDAWRRFLPHLKERLGWFLLYGLWLLVLMFGVAIGVLILVLVTCCVAGILLVLPYLGTVLLLPVYVALRALSLEFLEQFSDDFRLFPEPEPAPAVAPAPSGLGPGSLPPPDPA